MKRCTALLVVALGTVWAVVRSDRLHVCRPQFSDIPTSTFIGFCHDVIHTGDSVTGQFFTGNG